MNLTDDEKKVALKAAKKLGLDIAGVDMLRSKRGPLVIEVNSSPSLEGIEKATGKDMSFYWQQMGESTARFMNRHYSKSGKFLQEGYLILRDFFLKPSNFKYLKNYIKGFTLGNSKALDSYPDLSIIENNDSKFDD